jgi:PAS domain S-box-containing protein
MSSIPPPRPSDDDLDAEIARARLSAIVAFSDDAIVSKTLDGIITSWNPAAERMFGWTAAEAIGKHITLIIPRERHAEEDGVLAQIRLGERVDHFQTVRVAKDGRPVYISLSVSPIHDVSGRVVGASKVAHDVSDRRLYQISRAHLAAIIDSSDDAIVSKTLDGIITSWNPAAERMFGWTAAEAIGKHITLIIPRERHAEEEGVLARIRRGERIEHFDTVRITKDGRLVDVSITVSPIRDGDGHIIGASKIGRDIGDRRRLEDERVRLLAREQAARQEAERLNQSKDELLATVSHELRTPLTAIFGWARMLQTTAMDEAGRARAVDAIVRNASAQSRLVEDLLDLSRLVTGRLRLEFEAVDLSAVVEAALETVRPAADAKDITLTSELDRSLATTKGAPDRLQQVVLNLLTNAVKFTPSGGRVVVSVRPADKTVDLVVRDTGEGIAPEVLPHVFEPFRQEDSSSTRAHGGLGLGLTLVRQLVELHGGRVHAESPGKGQGSTFTVTLPRAAVTEAGGQEGQATTPVPADPLSGVGVLVIDDDPDFLDLSATMLRHAGADVRTASSAARAYELVNSWQPTVVLTDLAMPEEDGYTLLHVMRSMFAKRRLKAAIVAVTANGTPENRERAILEGFDRYLTKPVDPMELADIVANIARRSA